MVSDIDPAETAFAHLLDEWQSVTQIAAVDQLRRELAEVQRWSVGFDRMMEEQHSLRRENLWFHGRADIMGILSRQRRETLHSRMLAWLADPGTPTGLDVGFLQGFLALVDPELEGLERERLQLVRPELEVVRENARTDLVLFGDDFTVVIEVKVDAVEGCKQCLRTYQDFVDDPQPYFVFLTPRGRAPRTAIEEAEGEFQSMSFRDVRGVLAQAIDARWPELLQMLGSAREVAGPPFPTGVAACLNYARTLQEEFPG